MSIKEYASLNTKPDVKKKRDETINALITNDPDTHDSESIFVDFAVLQIAPTALALNQANKSQCIIRIMKVKETGRYRLIARDVKENYTPIANFYILPGNELNNALQLNAKNFIGDTVNGIQQVFRIKFPGADIDEDFKAAYTNALEENKKLRGY